LESPNAAANRVIAGSAGLCHGPPMMKFILLLAAAVPAMASPARAPAGEEARIPFVNFGGIRNFEANEDDVVYLEDRRRNWYRAEVIGPCLGLRWAHRIGVDTHGSSSFDRFSALIVDGDRCQLTSLVRSEKPPKRGKKKSG
jgi:hypothetical protein